jgi:hypothetical protein
MEKYFEIKKFIYIYNLKNKIGYIGNIFLFNMFILIIGNLIIYKSI